MGREPTPVETLIERITSWVGSVQSLALHTVVFIGSFGVAVFGFAEWDTVLLLVTTIVSLEAIYISILIQMTVNRQARDLHEVTEDVEEIQEDIEEIQEDVDEMQEDVHDISEDVEEIQEDVEEISDDWDLESGKPKGDNDAVIEELRKELRAIVKKLEDLNAA